MFKISTLFLNFLKWELLSSTLCILEQNCSDKKILTVFPPSKIMRGALLGPPTNFGLKVALDAFVIERNT